MCTRFWYFKQVLEQKIIIYKMNSYIDLKMTKIMSKCNYSKHFKVDITLLTSLKKCVIILYIIKERGK